MGLGEICHKYDPLCPKCFAGFAVSNQKCLSGKYCVRHPLAFPLPCCHDAFQVVRVLSEKSAVVHPSTTQCLVADSACLVDRFISSLISSS
jgi:S-adenosylmethionine:diacylglycerol 3-amino-3-carboxypropyl transferase